MNTVMIVTGESSGELYGSLLAKELRNKWPDVHIIGVGGERMNKAGVELVSNISDAFGIVEVVSAYRKVKATFNKTVDVIEKLRPVVIVLIDYPDFNIKVAKAAKAFGIKILYYVSPQVWAWRKGRVKKIANIVDRMAVILPFEENIYRKAGVTCEFVGHPILEEIDAVLGSEVRGGFEGGYTPNPELRAYFKATLGLDTNRPLLSLLPGSRPHELNRLLPLMIDVVRQFKSDPEINSGKDYQFCMPLAPNTDESRYIHHMELLKQDGVVIKKGESVKVLAASDLAVVASGTATLQTAFLEVPMVVVYKLSPFTYQLGKRVVRVKHITLVNILSGREVVKELLQEKANSKEVINELKKIMFVSDYREGMIKHYRKIKEPFLGKCASERVAEIVMEMAERK
ncbi:MAG: lipid-A-disaccharide synthase [Nitrospirota bacterium]